MYTTAMDLTERVLPKVAYRHWVLSFPIHLRFPLVRDERLLSKVRELFLRSVRVWQRAKARELGVRDALTGAVAFTQRFSSKITPLPHVHAIVPDGVFAKDESGKLVFHKLRPKQEDIEKIAARIARKAAKLFASLDDVLVPDALDHTRARATQEELALRIPLESVEPMQGRMLASVDGFSLQAARHLHENDRPGLEFLVRYVLRPPLSLGRMSELPNGKILIRLKRPMASGVAAIELTPMALMRRLASIVPPPGNHDTSYFGVFASHSAWRRKIVKPRRKDPEDSRTHPGLEPPREEILATADPVDSLANRDDFASDQEQPYISRALLLKKVFGFDVTRCECGALLRLKAVIEDPDRVCEELQRLGLWSEPPTIAKAKPSAQHEAFDLTSPSSACDGVDPPAPDCVA